MNTITKASATIALSYKATGILVEWTIGPKAGLRRVIRLYVDGNQEFSAGTFTERTLNGEWTECVIVEAEQVIDQPAEADMVGVDRKIARHRKSIAESARVSAQYGI